VPWRKIVAGGALSLALLGYAYAQDVPDEIAGTDETVQMEDGGFTVDPMSPIERASSENLDPAHKREVDPALQPLIDIARSDLETQLGPALAAVSLEVLEARAVTWPDPGLGCPAPGMVYIQVPVDGALIRFRASDGTIYEYHSGGRRLPFLCTNPPADLPLPPPGASEGV